VGTGVGAVGTGVGAAGAAHADSTMALATPVKSTLFVNMLLSSDTTRCVL